MQQKDIDSTDISILRALQADASISVGKLAERLYLSKSACWRRIQKLEDSGIIKERVTLLDQNQLELDLTTFIFIRTNKHNAAWSEIFKQTVESLPGVMEVYRMGGDVDYLIKAVVKDMKGYDTLYQQLIQADLFDVSAGFVMETIKHTHELPLPN